MARAKRALDFFDAFAELPPEQRATVVVGLQMFREVMRAQMGSVAFSREDILKLALFDEVHPLEESELSRFIAALRRLCGNHGG